MRRRTFSLAWLVVGLGVVLYNTTPGTAQSGHARHQGLGATGDWGRLMTGNLLLRPRAVTFTSPETRWRFRNRSRDQALAALANGGLDAAEVRAWAAEGHWRRESDGVSLLPPRRRVLALAGARHARLYETLAAVVDDADLKHPFPILGTLRDDLLAAGDLPQPMQDDFRRLLYPRGPGWAFADAGLLTAGLGPETKRRFWRMLSTSASYHVAVTAPTEAAARTRFAAYWTGPAGCQPPAALTSGRTTFDVAELLPPFAARRLHKFPEAADAQRDCFWSALNFCNETPRDAFSNPQIIAQTLEREHRPIVGPPRLGDLVVLVDRAGNPVHAAVYIADGLTFTKNGQGENQPWILMAIEELEDLYAIVRGPQDVLRTFIVRRLR